jgi:hypothetical protein
MSASRTANDRLARSITGTVPSDSRNSAGRFLG